jgi:hypothetical protein
MRPVLAAVPFSVAPGPRICPPFSRQYGNAINALEIRTASGSKHDPDRLELQSPTGTRLRLACRYFLSLDGLTVVSVGTHDGTFGDLRLPCPGHPVCTIWNWISAGYGLVNSHSALRSSVSLHSCHPDIERSRLLSTLCQSRLKPSVEYGISALLDSRGAWFLTTILFGIVGERSALSYSE